MNTGTELEAQIGLWRGFVRHQQSISAADAQELEEHLRDRIDELHAVGLDDDEAFLVAVKRMGDVDAISREFAREHSDRLWRQLVLVPRDHEDTSRSWRELAVVVAFGVGAGAALRAGISLLGEAMWVNVAFAVLPFLIGYLIWKRRVPRATLAAIATAFVALAVVVNAYPLEQYGITEVLVAIHVPATLWFAVGLAYGGADWRSGPARMNFIRFTGELAVYYALLALGGGILLFLTLMSFEAIDVDASTAVFEWILPCAAPGALVVAAFLVEAKQGVIENMAPVLTKVFTPLTLAMLVSVLIAYLGSPDVLSTQRELLIVMAAVLLLVVGLVLYALSARDPDQPPGVFDALQLALVVVAIVVDAVVLTAMVARIAEFGASANKIAALGLNLVLLVNLLRSSVLLTGLLRRRTSIHRLAQWQTSYLPTYAAWAAIVVIAIPPAFSFT